MPELLSPAGTFEKMEAAILYGADAVYLAGTAFGMRAPAGNFTDDELRQAVAYAHGRGVKVYLTVNVMPHWDEYEALGAYLDRVGTMGVDALIVADPGVLTLCRERVPHLPLHISTQTSVVSDAAARFWYGLGARRIVLARELTLREITEIRRRVPDDLELEVFIHGSMCVSYSGRCLLSNYYTGRDGNRGKCAQPCRWNYHLYEIGEEKRDSARLPLEADDRGTYVMSSKDLCMIEHIPELMEAGVSCFKIEGRMKSAYYTAVTANTYRMAIDAYRRDPAAYRYDPLWLRELESVSHREYATGFFFDDPQEAAQLSTTTGYLRENAYIGMVQRINPENGRAVVIQKNKATVGETLEWLTPGGVGQSFVCRGLWDENGLPIESVPHPSMIFEIELPFPARPGDILRRA